MTSGTVVLGSCPICSGAKQLHKVPESIAQSITQQQEALDKLRELYYISDPNQVICSYELSMIAGDDERVEVVADGLGGATLQRVEGTCDNTMCYQSREFETEEEACDAAELIDQDIDMMDAIFNGENPHLESSESENV